MATKLKTLAEEVNDWSGVVPLWVGHYLKCKYKEDSYDFYGCNNIGFIRLILAEQYGIPFPTCRTLSSSKEIFKHIINVNKKSIPLFGNLLHGHLIVALEVNKNDFLFGIKLNDKQMIAMLKTGPALITYKNNRIGEYFNEYKNN